MSEIKEIEEAVKKLSEEDLRKFRAWFASYDADIWDKQVEYDAASGKLNEMANEALSEYKEGKAREL
ncbi:hypothetical protein IQ255_27160 [Pleurocapsales cyanobacterium LEGE 10410]|nr:hypothetical protein [Pleurocapsales cyanobacterium LEGE 10410]